MHFEGSRELAACPHGAGGVYVDSLGSWTEDPYTSDTEWTEGYDWDGDGDWDSGADTDWSDDGDGDYDDGDWGGDGDWGDDGDWGGDDGDWGGDGDWATGHSSRSQQTRAGQSGKPRQGQWVSKTRR